MLVIVIAGVAAAAAAVVAAGRRPAPALVPARVKRGSRARRSS